MDFCHQNWNKQISARNSFLTGDNKEAEKQKRNVTKRKKIFSVSRWIFFLTRMTLLKCLTITQQYLPLLLSSCIFIEGKFDVMCVFSDNEALTAVFNSGYFFYCTEVSKKLIYPYRNHFRQVITGLTEQRIHILLVALWFGTSQGNIQCLKSPTESLGLWSVAHCGF